MKPTVPVTVEHTRLRELATRLGRLHAEDAQILALSTALYQIGCGADANESLGIERGKGHDDKKAAAHLKTQIAIRWIAGRMNLEGEKPPKKIDAIKEAAAAFKLEEDNLARDCPSVQELKRIATFDWNSQRPQLKKPRD